MTNFDTYLVRGPRPESFQWLVDNGFDRVINLESGAFNFFHDDRYEIESQWDSRVDQYLFKWSDFSAPSVKSLKLVARLLHKANENKIKTYIHCLHGEDRTGIAVATYQIIYQGTPIEEAIEIMYNAGFHQWPYRYIFNWVRQLRKLK